jgi:hypothetical protein
MDFFQRGSLATTTAGYGLDRWAQVSSGSGSNVTITQQTTGVPIGSRYCARITTGASAGYGNQFHYIETSNSATLWGKTATLSIKLRRSAAFAGTLGVVLAKSSTVDAGGGATWTTVGATTVLNSSLPTGTTSADWYTVTFTVAIPNDGSANSLRISIQQSQVETSAYWEMAQCQLEEGTAATTFSRAGGTIQGELAACQRYYFRTSSPSSFGVQATGMATSTTAGQVEIALPVTLRTPPSLFEYGSVIIADGVGSSTITSLVVNSYNQGILSLSFSGAAGLTQYRPYKLINNATVNGYIAVGSEL